MDVNNAYHLLSDKLQLWFNELIKLLPNLALAVLVLVAGFFIARYIKKLAFKFIRKFSHLETINRLFSSFVYLLFVGITVFAALNILQLNKTVTSILAGAGIVGLALALAFQDTAANFMSGIFISFRRPFNVGDMVKIKDYVGTVEDINLRDTVVRTFKGQDVIIPNKQVFQHAIENYSSSGKRRIDLEIRMSHHDDLEKVKELTIQAAEKLKVRSKTQDVTAFYESFSESCIHLSLRVWINTRKNIGYLDARSETIMLVKKAYDTNNIRMPFPIRTIDVDDKMSLFANKE